MCVGPTAYPSRPGEHFQRGLADIGRHPYYNAGCQMNANTCTQIWPWAIGQIGIKSLWGHKVFYPCLSDHPRPCPSTSQPSKYPSLTPAIKIWAASTTENKTHLALLLERKHAAVRVENWPYHLGLVAVEGNTFTNFYLWCSVARYE